MTTTKIKNSGNMAKQMRKAKKLIKDANMQDLTNPAKLLEEVQNTDSVKLIEKMGKAIEDGLMMNQEHIMIVQKNQIAFQDYFKAIYQKVEDLEKQIKKLNERIKDE